MYLFVYFCMFLSVYDFILKGFPAIIPEAHPNESIDPLSPQNQKGLLFWGETLNRALLKVRRKA